MANKEIMYDDHYGSKMGVMHGYQGFINKRRIKLFLKLLRPQKNDRILEIGCNDGLFLSFMQRHCKNCYGIDINKDILKKSRVKHTMLMDSTKMTFKDKSFNKIYSSHVVEHVADVKKYFKEVSRVLAPGGTFVLMFPWELFRGMRAIKDSFGFGESPFVYARKLHLHRLTPRKVKQLIKGLPLRVVKSGIHIALLFPDYFMVFEKTKKR